MTNGEKLIKEYPEFVAKYLAEMCYMYGDCEYCPLSATKDCGDEDGIKEWLESEAEDNA